MLAPPSFHLGQRSNFQAITAFHHYLLASGLCHRCFELHTKIELTRRLSEQVIDRVTIERLKDLIREYKRQLDRVGCHEEV